MPTLTTTITEAVALVDGTTRSNVISEEYTVDDILERIVTIGAAEVTLYTTHASVAEGNVFNDNFVKYARISNMHASQTLNIRVTNAGTDEALFKIKAGESFILNGHDDMCSFNEGTADATLHAISSIKAAGSGAGTPVEIFVASSSS
mgnify:FL=1|jgi:hypothetical protein